MVPFWESNIFENKWLVAAVLAGFGLQIVPFSTPVFRNFFGTTIIDFNYWLIAIGLSIMMFFVVEVFKFFYFFKHRDNMRLKKVD